MLASPFARAVALPLAMLVACVAGADEELDLTPSSVAVDQIIAGGPPKDAIHAIVAPQFVGASQAGFLMSDDPVIGVVVAEEAKAYPLRIMNWHQAVNDTISGRAVVVTYCPLSASAVVFDRIVDGKLYTFGVSGRLYESNLLLYDQQTQSLWSQLGASALTGARIGAKLDEIPSVSTAWSEWRDHHPSTLVLAPDTQYPRDYTLNPYIAYESGNRLMFQPSRRDPRLGDKQKILGVVVGDHARAYPLSELAHAASPVHDRIADEEVTIAFDGTSASASSAGVPIAATSAYWFAWTAFHPSTEIWTAPYAEPLPGPVRNDDIRIEETNAYWTQLPCTLTSDPDHQQFATSGLFVISGKLKNRSDLPLHHIRLRFELFDTGGQVVHREEGYNRSAESLMELEEGAVADGENHEVREIPPGGSDTFRMIMIGDEIPPFDHSGVSVVTAR